MEGAIGALHAGVDRAARQAVESVTARKASQRITFGALAGKTYGAADFRVSASDVRRGGTLRRPDFSADRIALGRGRGFRCGGHLHRLTSPLDPAAATT